MNALNLESLKRAVGGEFAGIRRITRLEPQGDKIFPPTYEGGEYADEQRLVKIDNNGREEEAAQFEVVETILLDSVQSQANRLEMAMLRAYDDKRLRMP